MAAVVPPAGRLGWRLDEQMAVLRARSPQPWGAGVAGWPLAASVVLLVGTWALATRGGAGPVVGTLLSLGFYAVLVVVVVAVGRPVARRGGGWSATFGWSRPGWRDLAWVVPVLVAGGVARAAVVTLVVTAVPAWRDAQPSNVDLAGQPPSVVAVVAVLAVGVAPPVEELVFRGLVLRSLLRRTGFWPAALASSVLFGLFHTYQVPTLDGAVLLGVNLTVFGLVQCLLVRRTGRLAPAVAVHAASNALAVALSAGGVLG